MIKETTGDIRNRIRDAQKNYSANIKRIEDILLAERGYITRVPQEENIVAICSGGLDSSVMINRIIEDYNAIVHLLFFRRGAGAQEHEEHAFDFFTEFYKDRFPENIGYTAKLDCQIPPATLKEWFAPELAKTIGHPLRNSTMQNLAVMYAASLNGKYGIDIKTIFTGSVGDDYTEPESGLLSLRSQTLNTCIQMGDWLWQITSPLTDPVLASQPVYKTDLIRYAIDKGIPLEKTRSCFSAGYEADGTCFACKKRLLAFEQANVKDPAAYK